jgi:hypothetical protein
MASLKRDNRNLKDFSKLDLLAAGEIHLSQSDDYYVVIEAEDSILEYLTAEIRDGVLRLGLEKDRNIHTKLPIRYFITMPKIEVIRVSGAGKVKVPSVTGKSFLLDIAGAADIEIGLIEVTAFTLDVKGAGDVWIGEVRAQGLSFNVKGTLALKLPAIKAEAVTHTIDGSCTMELGGKAKAQIIHAPGLINYQASKLQSSQVSVNAKGMANLTLWVEDILTVRLEGMGKLHYYGSPERNIKINGFGRINRLGDAPKFLSSV